MNILEIKEVSKIYETYTALDKVSFQVPKGKIFGLLGPNGAGKTSLIRIITSITRADSGVVFFEGEKLNERHPEKIGYMPEERGLYKKMMVGEQLLYLAQLKGLSTTEAKKNIQFWAEKLGIETWMRKKVEELSKGMQQKVQFIVTVIHQPSLLILDEPFSGLDPVNANLIKDEIYELHQQGTTIIFSTHRMEQVEEICDNIVLINKGKNVLEGEVAEVKQRFKQNLFKIDFIGQLPEALSTKATIIKQYQDSVSLQLLPPFSANDILLFLLQNQVQIKAFNEILPTLNEIFIKQVASANS